MAEPGGRWGLQVRIMVAAAICAVVGVPPVMFVTAITVAQQASQAQLQPDAPGVAASTADCLEAGGHWTHQTGAGATGFAYELATGRSVHPDAPPVPPELLAAVQAGQPSVGRAQFLRPYPGGIVAVRTPAPSGPCSLMVVRWRPFGDSRSRIMQATLILGAVLLGLAIFVSQSLAIRPLLERLAALGRGATEVGEPGFAPPAAGPQDAVRQVWDDLDRAHRRIVDAEQALRSRQQALERHLSDVAHDLRTPIAGLQLILEEIASATEPQPARARAALRDLHYLTALTENLREAARLDEGVHPLASGARVDLAALVVQVGARMERLARGSGVEVSAASDDEAVVVHCDGSMAERLLANLVANAVEAGAPGGHVAVHLQQEGGRFSLAVLDDGPGIPAAVRAALDQRGKTSAVRRTDGGHGTGLGLAIVHRVCAMAGWTLELGRLPDGTGTRIVVAGPVVAEAVHGTPP